MIANQSRCAPRSQGRSSEPACWSTKPRWTGLTDRSGVSATRTCSLWKEKTPSTGTAPGLWKR